MQSIFVGGLNQAYAISVAVVSLVVAIVAIYMSQKMKIKWEVMDKVSFVGFCLVAFFSKKDRFSALRLLSPIFGYLTISMFFFSTLLISWFYGLLLELSSLPSGDPSLPLQTR